MQITELANNEVVICGLEGMKGFQDFITRRYRGGAHCHPDSTFPAERLSCIRLTPQANTELFLCIYIKVFKVRIQLVI